ncbi:MAG: DNA repair exonuclease [Gemmatimonas sp.]|nr:DNA repair exonuclease [Gemmatimonas sp.]
MKILCSGDLHLGRYPTRLPAGVPRESASVSERWLAMVELAIEEGAEVVALSGDLVDRANRYFEAFGPLEEGLRRLGEAEIVTVAVAGNHDFDVLPRLARSLPAERFRLLGEGGQWEREVVRTRRGEELEVHGWSFPAEQFVGDPLQGYGLEADEGCPVLGLAHCEVDGWRSRYGPVSARALRARPPGFWLLGHIHQPRLLEEAGAGALLYPGTPQPLDPGEPGPHGVWWVETEEDRFGEPEFRPLATVRYEAVDVDVDGAQTVGEVQARLLDAVTEERDQTMEGAGVRPSWLSIHARLTGRTRVAQRAIEAEVSAHIGDLELGGEARCRVDRIDIATLPRLELEELARGGDATGHLAELLLRLDSSLPEVAALVEKSGAAAERVVRSSAYLPLRARAAGAPPLPEAAEVLRRQAYRLLEELVVQKENV